MFVKIKIVMYKLCFLVISFLLLFLSCKINNNKNDKNIITTDLIKVSEIPFTIAERYFIKNDVVISPETVVTTKDKFDELFGMAAVMGDNGMPTSINFSKEFVIAVSKPETNYSTEFIPLSLKRNENGDIVFTYKEIKGEKQSYYIVPCLLIVVNNEQKGEIIFNQIH